MVQGCKIRLPPPRGAPRATVGNGGRTAAVRPGLRSDNARHGTTLRFRVRRPNCVWTSSGQHASHNSGTCVCQAGCTVHMMAAVRGGPSTFGVSFSGSACGVMAEVSGYLMSCFDQSIDALKKGIGASQDAHFCGTCKKCPDWCPSH